MLLLMQLSTSKRVAKTFIDIDMTTILFPQSLHYLCYFSSKLSTVYSWFSLSLENTIPILLQINPVDFAIPFFTDMCTRWPEDINFMFEWHNIVFNTRKKTFLSSSHGAIFISEYYYRETDCCHKQP